MKTTLNFKHRKQSIQFNQNALIQVVVPPPHPTILICLFFCCLNVYMMNLKQIMSHVCNIMVREGWLSPYPVSRCMPHFIMNYFYVTFILICLFFCCLNVYMMNLKQIMSHVCQYYGEGRMAVRGEGEGRPSQIILYLDVCFAEM